MIDGETKNSCMYNYCTGLFVDGCWKAGRKKEKADSKTKKKNKREKEVSEVDRWRWVVGTMVATTTIIPTTNAVPMEIPNGLIKWKMKLWWWHRLRLLLRLWLRLLITKKKMDIFIPVWNIVPKRDDCLYLNLSTTKILLWWEYLTRH